MQDELSQLWESISRIRDLINQLQKYNSNKHYKQKYEKEILQLNRNYKFFKVKVMETDKPSLIKNLGQLHSSIDIILSRKTYKTKLDTIKELELFWPDLEVDILEITPSKKTFEIPKEIPMNEQRLDLEEAIRDFNSNGYLSTSVLCRRAYEGALVIAYKSVVKNDPIEEVKCPGCKNTLRKSYMGIVKLHNWAIANNLITDKLKSIGYLISDLGAGGAHPPLTDFPRDPEIAKISIQTTIAILKQIFSKLKELE